MRWVDDCWFAIVVFANFLNFSVDVVARISGAVRFWVDVEFQQIHRAYENGTDLKLKVEDPNVFAGIKMEWQECQVHMGQFFEEKLFPKYKNGFSYSSRTQKLGLISVQIYSILDRAHCSQIACSVRVLVHYLLYCGCDVSVISLALSTLCIKSPHLSHQLRVVAEAL